MSQTEVRQALTQLGLSTSEDIADFLKSPKSTVNSALRLMMQKKEIGYIQGKIGYKKRVYYLV